MTQSLPVPASIENALGVCGVREDTRLLAEIASQVAVDSLRGVPGRALDLGTGSGYVGICLALRGWQVDAVDVSSRALELARRNAEANGARLRIYYSDLFSAVSGPYDVIACNPPMRSDETEASRLLTASLRRVELLANLLMRVTQPVLERRRSGFLAEIANGSRCHMAQGGRLILVISPLEEAVLPKLVSGLRRQQSHPVRAIPGLNVVTFAFAEIG